MTKTVAAQQLSLMIQRIAAHINEHRDNLNALDSALGDGDHGTGISTAFKAASDDLTELSDPDVTTVFKTTASALMNRMGGASGALYGTLFLKAALTTKGKETLSKADFNTLLEAGLDGVKQRGKSDVGDKTMIDALHPAVKAFTDADDLSSGWANATDSAQHGAISTVDLVAKHGRAKFAGERAKGHMDAGAKSIALMFEALHNYWKEES